MRNLRLSLARSRAFDVPPGADNVVVVPRSPYTSDADVPPAFYVCTTESAVVVGDQSTATETSVFDTTRSDGRVVSVVGVQFLAETDTLCVALDNGELIEYSAALTESVGAVETGIVAMSWSADQELFVLLTGANTLMVMTKEYDLLVEQSLAQEGFGAAAPVTVGWGSKQTQFHGSAGKAAAHAPATRPGEANTSELDDGRSRVAWRGDGAYFVTSQLVSTDQGRQLRVWTRDGTLHSTMEHVAGVEGALAWRPDGGLIASSQRRPHRHDIVFYERNGLRHGEFTLRQPVDEAQRVTELAWNCDSSVLAVALGNDVVQLWSASNYQWHLRQQLSLGLGSVAQHPLWWHWDDENAGVLYTVGADPSARGDGHEVMHTFHYAWAVDASHGWAKEASASTVAVIDGATVKLSHFRQACIPPPLCAEELPFASPCRCVAFADSSSVPCALADTGVAALLVSGELVHFSPDGNVHTLASGLDASARLLCWTSAGALAYICRDDDDTTHDRICVVPISSAAKEPPTTVALPQRAISACSHGAHTLVVGLATSSSVVSVDLRQGTITTLFELAYPPLYLAVAPTPPELPLAVVTLSAHGHLCYDEREISRACTSMSAHSSHLLYTTSAHVLHALPWSHRTTTSSAPPFERNIERGSRIVVSVTADTRVVLQMPRGNLEVVHPRVLVLERICDLLDAGDYIGALEDMRLHRIDMNLCIDRSPARFFAHVGNVLEQFLRAQENVEIEQHHHLLLLLAALRDEDVTVTTYPGYALESVTGGVSAAPAAAEGKTDRVCDAVRVACGACSEADRERLRLVVITSLARKSTPELETVLNMIRDHRLGGDLTGADSMLGHACFLVPVDKLFDYALGLYDFELVLMVAERSKKDPREYIPFLQELQALPEMERRFAIDCHLGRHERALVHLVELAKGSSDDDEGVQTKKLLGFARQHSLHRQALRLVSATAHPTLHHAVLLAYAQATEERGDQADAALLYERCGAISEAIASYQAALQWQRLFALATHKDSGLTTAAVREQLGPAVARELFEAGRFAEAAVVYREHADDVEQALLSLFKCNMWREATRVAGTARRWDVMETDGRPLAQAEAEHRLEVLRENTTQLRQHVTRLFEVREEKRREALGGGGGVGEAGGAEEGAGDDADLFSETGSSVLGSTASRRSTSLSSVLSSKSSRNRKKLLMKKRSLRRGGLFEEEALMHAISDILVHADSSRESVRELCESLCMFGLFALAEDLQEALYVLLGESPRVVNRVWPPHSSEEEAASAREGESLTQMMARVALHERQKEMPPAPTLRKRDDSWIIDAIKKM